MRSSGGDSREAVLSKQKGADRLIGAFLFWPVVFRQRVADPIEFPPGLPGVYPALGC